jgi:predicted aspartyl protease
VATAAGSSDCSAELAAEWQVRLVREQPLIDGFINGQPVGVKLDTGATRTMLFRSAAQRLGLALQRTRARMFGVGGEADLEVALVDEFKIGASTRQGSRMLVASDRNRNEAAAVLLGYDFLRKFDVEFDLVHNAVRLYHPKECNRTLTAAWGTGRVNEAEIEPIDELRPQVVLALRINGQPVQALLDSGAEVSILSKRDAAAAGVTPETPGVTLVGAIGGLGGKPITTWIGPFLSVAIGNEMITDAVLPFADLYRRNTYTPIGSLVPVTVDERQLMLLGVDFLRAHRVLIAHNEGKVCLLHLRRWPGVPGGERIRAA